MDSLIKRPLWVDKLNQILERRSIWSNPHGINDVAISFMCFTRAPIWQMLYMPYRWFNLSIWHKCYCFVIRMPYWRIRMTQALLISHADVVAMLCRWLIYSSVWNKCCCYGWHCNSFVGLPLLCQVDDLLTNPYAIHVGARFIAYDIGLLVLYHPVDALLHPLGVIHRR